MGEPDRAGCRELIRYLADLIDGEIDPSAAGPLYQHLDACRPCSARFDFERWVVRRIGERLRELRAPAGLGARIARLVRTAEWGGPDVVLCE